MKNQKSPSLFLPKLVAFLFIVIFISGMSEVFFLAKTLGQTDPKLTTKVIKGTDQLTNAIDKVAPSTTEN